MPDGREMVEGTVLSFEKVTRRHAGTYICTANNGFGRNITDKIHVDVEYIPEVEVEEYFIHATAANKAELVCNVHAHPMATVSWFKDTIKISDDDVDLKKLGHKHILTIPSLSHQDYGNYTCRAKNSIGESSKILELSGTHILTYNK